MKTKPVSLRLKIDLIENIKQLAEKEDRNFNNMFVHMAQEYIKNNPLK